jgi:hypothetical protein
MSEEIGYNRRRFLGAAAMTLAAAQCGILRSAEAQRGDVERAAVPSIKPGTNMSFTSLKQIEAGFLNVGYAEAGPIDGPVAVLLHGWPYDIYSYVDVAPLLAAAGYRVIVPYLRRRIRTPVLMPRNSRVNTRTGSSRAASVTIYLRKPRRLLPKLWSTWATIMVLARDVGRRRASASRGVETPDSAHPAQTRPDLRTAAFGMALSQALRARLRSHRLWGAFRDRGQLA